MTNLFLVHEDKELRIRLLKNIKLIGWLCLYTGTENILIITNNLKKMRRHYKKLIQKHKR